MRPTTNQRPKMQAKNQSAPWQDRVTDPRDPLWSSIKELTVGQSPEQASKTLREFVDSLPKVTEQQMKQYDLENLPFDPALEAGKESREYREDDPTRHDTTRAKTEEDGIRAEALRRLQVRRMFQETVPDPRLV